MGRSRRYGDVFAGSARIALNTADPPFTHLRFFELDELRAGRLITELASEYPRRNVRVYAGDCNERIPEALRELQSVSWAPTFAFLDPDGIHLTWSTVRTLAHHKRGHRYKVELWLLFSTMALARRLALSEGKLRPEDAAAATAAFGDESWRPIYERRRAEEIPGRMARAEYINLYRWKLEQELEYHHTFALEIRNESGGPLYAMVFATDHDAGRKIMLNLYHKAARAAPRRRELMRAEQMEHQQLSLEVGEAGVIKDPLWTNPP